jgi:hypothetical protein
MSAALSYDDEIQVRRLLSDFGTSAGEAGLIYQQDPFTGDGSMTVFTLSQTPVDYPVFVYLAGVLQQSPEQMSVSGTTLTFVIAPGNTVAIVATYCYA